MASLEQNYSHLRDDYFQLQSRFASEMELSDLKTQKTIDSVEIMNKLVEEVRYKVTALDSETADVSDRLQNLSRNVSVTLQSVCQEAMHAIDIKQVYLLKRSLSEVQLETEIISLKQKMKDLKKEQLSLHSQLHHPVTAFSNCRTDVYNSTCRMDATTGICLTERVSREVEVSL